jgi:hypothetical protein
MMALIGEAADELDGLFPRFERAHRALGEPLDGLEHTLDDSMLIAENPGRLFGLMAAS